MCALDGCNGKISLAVPDFRMFFVEDVKSCEVVKSVTVEVESAWVK